VQLESQHKLLPFSPTNIYILTWLFWLGTTYLSTWFLFYFNFFPLVCNNWASFLNFMCFFGLCKKNIYNDWSKDSILKTKGKWDKVWTMRLVWWLRQWIPFMWREKSFYLIFVTPFVIPYHTKMEIMHFKS
jgi:hypothetical protein